MKIECQTLFDITRTDVHSRRFRLDNQDTDSDMVRRRGQQSNFETVIQIISMRALPENITTPEKSMMALREPWGTKYKNKSKVPLWSFTFEVDNIFPFDNGIDQLGNLLEDCANVPMTIKLGEWSKLEGQLNVSNDLRNIVFRVV